MLAMHTSMLSTLDGADMADRSLSCTNTLASAHDQVEFAVHEWHWKEPNK